MCRLGGKTQGTVRETPPTAAVMTAGDSGEFINMFINSAEVEGYQVH